MRPLPLLLCCTVALAAERRVEVAAAIPDRQPTGVAVAAGRMFVCFPRWDPVSISVAEVQRDGRLVPWPDATINRWQAGDPPGERFVCVQSVWSDGGGGLWILDAGSPRMEGVIPGAPKLVRCEAIAGTVSRVIAFDGQIAPPRSYLNDVRLLPGGNVAVITDSGLGALVVVDLATGTARRRLEGHPALRADPARELTVAGRSVRTADGATPQVHVDGIAIDDAGMVYLHALTADDLWRIPGALLADPAVDDTALAAALEKVATTGPCDGMLWHDGQLWLTALERNAILRFDPARASIAEVARDPGLAWPDSLAAASDGAILVTASQIHLMPRFNRGRDDRRSPYLVLRLPPP